MLKYSSTLKYCTVSVHVEPDLQQLSACDYRWNFYLMNKENNFSNQILSKKLKLHI